MQRVEFRKLKMYDKLILIKEAVKKGVDKEQICLMVDECIYNTGDYMKGTSKRKEIFTKSELDVLRKEKREQMGVEPIRRIRWTKDNIATEARKRYEKAINEAHLQ